MIINVGFSDDRSIDATTSSESHDQVDGPDVSPSKEKISYQQFLHEARSKEEVAILFFIFLILSFSARSKLYNLVYVISCLLLHFCYCYFFLASVNSLSDFHQLFFFGIQLETHKMQSRWNHGSTQKQIQGGL